MDHVDDLRRTVKQLEQAYERARADVISDITADRQPTSPEQARDANGRFILLDALTELVHARCVLAAVDRER